MPSQVLRRLSKPQLMEALRRTTAAPFHPIIWDNQPVRLADALRLLERDPDDAFYYATRGRVFTTRAAAGQNR